MSDHGGSSEGDGPIPKRSSIACDSCRKRKIRCDSTSSPCFNCVNYNVECVFTRTRKVRKAPRESVRRIDELESRLLHMETLLQETRSSISDAKESAAPQNKFDPSLERRPWSGTPPTNSAFNLSVTATDTRFNTTNSRLSTEAISYLQQTVGPSPTSEDGSLIAESGFNVHKRGHTRLPKKDEALVLLMEFLEGFNNMLPLFHPKVLLQSFERDYTRDQPKDSALWAVWNVVLALSIRMNSNREELGAKASEYAQNAFDVIPELTMQQADLTAIQALLGMAMLLQGTPNPQPASILTAAAIRLSYGLGMHRNELAGGLPPIEAQQRQRVFWVAYCLDKDFSLRFEQPPIINDNDMNVHLPEVDPHDGLGLMNIASDGSVVNYFRLRIHLAVIQSKAYTDLYSVRAQQQSEDEKLSVIQKLDQLLEQWRTNLPAGLQPDDLAAFVGPFANTHIVILHLTYFNCLATVHRVSFFQNRLWASSIMAETDQLSGPIPHRLCVSAIRCNEAARASLYLMNLIPQGDFACTWILFSHCVSAIVILLARIIHRPTDGFSHSDMALVRPKLHLLNSLAEKRGTEEVRRMSEACNELAGRAQLALDRYPQDEILDLAAAMLESY